MHMYWGRGDRGPVCCPRQVPWAFEISVAQGYLGSVLKVSWHLLLPRPHFSNFGLSLELEPRAINASNIKEWCFKEFCSKPCLKCVNWAFKAILFTTQQPEINYSKWSHQFNTFAWTSEACTLISQKCSPLWGRSLWACVRRSKWTHREHQLS